MANSPDVPLIANYPKTQRLAAPFGSVFRKAFSLRPNFTGPPAGLTPRLVNPRTADIVSRSFWKASETQALHSAGTIHDRIETYEILTSGRLFRHRKLTRIGVKRRAGKEAIMVDVAFVALGVAVLALIGAYALALHRL